MFGGVASISKTGVAMRKAILMMLLAVVSSGAMADWVQIDDNETVGITAYADPASIRQAGNRVKMWVLVDYKTAKTTADGKTFMSVKSQNEYDCKEEKSRIFYANIHPKNMAGGEIVSVSIKPRDWEPNEPGSVGEALWKIACRR